MEILCMTFLLCRPVWTPPELRGAITAGYISKTLHSHVSLVKLCETIFGLKTLNARAAAADGMTDCFDFTQKPALPQSNTQPTTQ
jgi:hypothetical protein